MFSSQRYGRQWCKKSDISAILILTAIIFLLLQSNQFHGPGPLGRAGPGRAGPLALAIESSELLLIIESSELLLNHLDRCCEAPSQGPVVLGASPGARPALAGTPGLPSHSD